MSTRFGGTAGTAGTRVKRWLFGGLAGAVAALGAATPALAQAPLTPPACSQDDGTVCLDTPEPYLLPQVLQFRVPSSDDARGDWNELDPFGGTAGTGGSLERITLLQAGPPGGLSTWQAVLPTNEPFLSKQPVFIQDGSVKLELNGGGSSGVFRAQVIAAAVNTIAKIQKAGKKARARKEGRKLRLVGRFSYEGRRELRADLLLELQGDTGGKWEPVTQVQTSETTPPGAQRVETPSLKGRCPSIYRKCRFHAKGELFAFVDGEWLLAGRAESIPTKFNIKP